MLRVKYKIYNIKIDLYGGYLLGIGTKSEIYFYNWSDLTLIHRVEIPALNV